MEMFWTVAACLHLTATVYIYIYIYIYFYSTTIERHILYFLLQFIYVTLIVISYF